MVLMQPPAQVVEVEVPQVMDLWVVMAHLVLLWLDMKFQHRQEQQKQLVVPSVSITEIQFMLLQYHGTFTVTSPIPGGVTYLMVAGGSGGAGHGGGGSAGGGGAGGYLTGTGHPVPVTSYPIV